MCAGDSITDCGRREEYGPLGAGYVRMTADFLRARYPNRSLSFINAGINGNTVRDLSQRWETDVLSHKPNWVTIMIGINDIHRMVQPDPRGDVPLDIFETCYRDIVERTVGAGARIVILDPFYMSSAKSANAKDSSVLEMIVHYIAVGDRLGEEVGALRVRTHELFQEQLRHSDPSDLGPEPFHPYPVGHAIIAHGLLEALSW